MSQAGILNAGGGGAGPIDKITGNSGTVTPDVNSNVNVVTANTTVKFTGAASTLTEDFGLTNLLIGDNGASIAGATENVGVGLLALHSITTGSLNTAIGSAAGEFITTGTQNTIIGADSATGLTTGANNVIIGESAGGVSNGSNNILVGVNAGIAPVLSSNIMIGNQGVAAESNTTRIGTQGTGAGQQSRIFLAGVLNTTSGRVRNITFPGAYPYTSLITDDVIMVDTSVARTIIPMAAPVNGTTYSIKDYVGSAAANNVTITPSGHTVDGAASYILNNNYESVEIIYSSVAGEWKVI